MSSHPANKWCVYIPTQATVCWHRLFTTLDTSTEPPGDSLWELWCWQHLTTFWTSIFGIFHLNYSEQLSASPKGNLPKTTCQDSQNQGFWNASLRKNEKLSCLLRVRQCPRKPAFLPWWGSLEELMGAIPHWSWVKIFTFQWYSQYTQEPSDSKE